ncbi:hypothetical protein [Candidatus Magnetomonas plexicatena]|uniref:hypothetical protein n=1 Tax=Candidatus Magnetomonas plexicatena TaxID=2552947 RepID=UPI001C78EA74|nr:BrnT family toxin [Nitrospirales bacterium LBB_01]
MVFEWSEEKRLKVLKERNLDFLKARYLFDGRHLHTVPSPRGEEERWVSIGRNRRSICCRCMDAT